MADDDATRRVDPDDNSTRRVDPDDFATVRGLSAGRNVFGRYMLEAELGAGGMGVVWRARDTELDEPVALKFLPEVVARDDAAVDELKDETRHARRLTHPNIVRIHQFEREGNVAAVSMELVDGVTLTKLRLAQPGKVFTVETLAPLVAQLCTALDYAHSQAKIVHRDLKPANILVTRDGVVKVTDFGIARSLSESSTRLTGKGGDTSGTIPYMSPQQVRGSKPRATDDLYALGATLYELLTSRPPFFRGDPHSLRMQIIEEAPLSLAARREELRVNSAPIPPAWENTILACLAKDPEKRPQSAGEVAQLLRICGRSAQSNGSSQRSRIALLAVLGLAVAGWWFFGSYLPSRQATATAVQRATAEPARQEAQHKIDERPRFENEKAAGEQQAYDAILAQIDGTKPGNSIETVNRTAQTVTRYLADAPERFREEVSKRWQAAREAAMLPREFTVMVAPPDVGARLWLGPLSDVEIKDGKALLKDLPDGEQELTVQASGYQPFTTRVTVKDGRGSVEAKLVPVRGAVAVTARPGTQVTAVDERGRETRLGAVPVDGVLTVENLLTLGRYTLRLEHADCAVVTMPGMELVVGRTIKVAPAQTPLPGELRIFSVPTGAEVRVNGEVAGSTPATIKNQPTEQALRVEVFLRGYRRMEQSVTLKPKEMRTVNVGTLVAESGWIDLRFTNDDLRLEKATITVDGKAITRAATSSSRVGAGSVLVDGLEVGLRTVEVAHPDYEPWRQTVTVRDEQTTPVEVTLKPKPAAESAKSAPVAPPRPILKTHEELVAEIEEKIESAIEKGINPNTALTAEEAEIHNHAMYEKAAKRAAGASDAPPTPTHERLVAKIEAKIQAAREKGINLNTAITADEAEIYNQEMYEKAAKRSAGASDAPLSPSERIRATIDQFAMSPDKRRASLAMIVENLAREPMSLAFDNNGVAPDDVYGSAWPTATAARPGPKVSLSDDRAATWYVQSVDGLQVVPRYRSLSEIRQEDFTVLGPGDRVRIVIVFSVDNNGGREDLSYHPPNSTAPRQPTTFSFTAAALYYLTSGPQRFSIRLPPIQAPR